MSKKIGSFPSLLALAMVLFVQSAQAQIAQRVPDSPEAKKIEAVLERAYEVIGAASRTFDVSKFSTVFVDTSDFDVTPLQEQSVAEILGGSTTGPVGYLTAMRAKYVSLGQGAKLLREALDKAKAENRKLTEQDFLDLAEQNHGRMPSLGSAFTARTSLTYKSIEIAGDRAVVRYDDGAALQEAVVVRIGERWYVAGIKPLWVHF
jgi:hypothetical protein